MTGPLWVCDVESAIAERGILNSLFDALADGLRQLAVDADEVHRHEHGAMAGGVFEHERLGPQVVVLRGGRLVAGGVAGEPDGQLGRDVDAGDAGLPVLVRRRARLMTQAR